MVDNGSDKFAMAKAYLLLLFETNSAKEARKQQDCRGKPLDCYCVLGIAVWTKW